MKKAFIKKALAIILCFAVLASLPLSVGAASDEITITDKYLIYVSDESLNEAAKYLNRYIEEICGYKLKITDIPPNGMSISLAINPKAENAYTIRSDTLNVYITGKNLRNTVDGICEFLEKYGGIHYYAAECVVKEKTEITIPKNTEYSYTPFFEMTDTDWYSPTFVDYSLFNGLSSNYYRKVPAELGGGVEYITSLAHTYTNQFCNKDKYFEEYPECFALSAVARNKESLCLSNPKTLEIVEKEVFELLEQKHNPNATLQIVSLTQNDNMFFCTCPDCLAKYVKYGAIGGLNLEFANAIARKVKEAGYDNVAIDTFAYQYTRLCPKGIVPEDNVIIRLCSIECCFSHSLDNPLCAANMFFANDLKDWAKICNRLYIWDYTTNYSHYIGIFPDFSVLQPNIQFFYENNVKGIYAEGNYSMAQCDTEFGELRSYLISRLLKDPYCDIKAEQEAFCKAYYGEGGKYVSEFVDTISENAKLYHLSIYTSMEDTCMLTNRQIKQCDKLWEEAKQAATGEALEHVKYSELAWRFWKYKNNASEFSSILTRKEVRAQFDEEMDAAPIKAKREFDENRAFWLGVLQIARFILSDALYPVLFLVSKFI